MRTKRRKKKGMSSRASKRPRRGVLGGMKPLVGVLAWTRQTWKKSRGRSGWLGRRKMIQRTLRIHEGAPEGPSRASESNPRRRRTKTCAAHPRLLADPERWGAAQGSRARRSNKDDG